MNDMNDLKKAIFSFGQLDDAARLAAVHALACAVAYVDTRPSGYQPCTEYMEVMLAGKRIVAYLHRDCSRGPADARPRSYGQRMLLFGAPDMLSATNAAEIVDGRKATWSAYTFCVSLIELYIGEDLLAEIQKGMKNPYAALPVHDMYAKLTALMPDSMPAPLVELVTACIAPEWRTRLTIADLASKVAELLQLQLQLQLPAEAEGAPKKHRFILRWAPDERELQTKLQSRLHDGYLHLYDSDVPTDLTMRKLWDEPMRHKRDSELVRLKLIPGEAPRAEVCEEVCVEVCEDPRTAAIVAARVAIMAAQADMDAAQAAMAAAQAATVAAQAALSAAHL
jgi:hypothetical protein